MTAPPGPTATHPPGAGVGRAFLKLGAGEIGARLIAFGATVYLARTLGASAYGVVVLATAVLLYLNVLTDCGIDMLGVQEIAAGPDALVATVPEVLGARLLVATALAATTSLVGLTVLPQPEGGVLAAYSMTLLAVGLGTRWVHIGLGQTGRAALVRVAVESVAALLIVATVRGPSDLGRAPVALMLGESVGVLLLLRLLPRTVGRLRIALRPAMVHTLLARSWPMVLHALLGLAIFNSDFLFLRWLRDSAAVGLYAAAYTLISFFLNLATAYTMSLIPALTRLRALPGEGRAVFDLSMVQILAGAVPVTAGGILVADAAIRLVFGADYAGAAAPLQVLLLLLPLAAVRHVAQAGLLAHGRQDQLLRTVAWAAAANLVLNLLLIPRWGLLGAAAATVVTEGLRAVLALGFTGRLGLPMTGPRRFMPVAVAALLMSLVVLASGPSRLWLAVPLGVGSYAAALAAMGRLGIGPRRLPELRL